ncbi:MAG TPA: 4-(cytidine 5'-diphospho)-2-C-methyl-D-erythritol kinase [Stellaceae bacterium]|nr:4-(cytidine 5'-diphospho)-2-C-methyl-D-erythritol kinase [Stellaceae bacterium]
MDVTAFAPAKVNLYLHVVGRRADGYHLLDSLVAFADIGDRVTARPAREFSLTVSGPESAGLEALGEDNLVLRAARALAARAGAGGGAALHLDKHLPVASGIGGGSSDAAATLRALAALWGIGGEGMAMALAAKLGADVPVCLLGRPAWVSGAGEQLSPANGLPRAGILLVNPRRPLPTADVFQARAGAFGEPGRFAEMPQDAAGLARALASRRNDLAEAALALVPEIAQVLNRLAALPGSLLARMSGSGATCFALFADRPAAERAGAVVAAAEPRWWCAAGELAEAPAPSFTAS